MTEDLYIGMLSGTSRDGVDAVLVNISDGSMDLLHATCTAYPPAIKMTLDQLLETGGKPSADVVSLLDENLGRFFARSAQNLVREAGMEMRDIRAIGSHGQNVWHQPGGENPLTLQLGRGDIIARNTSTTVVANFRTADVKAGGQGAPLAPLLHRELFHSASEDRAILNIGGIANLTILPAEGGVSGFDCGPGNCLMDAWTSLHLQKDFDENGRWAAKGRPDQELLHRLLADPFFSQAPPKSTGLEYFNLNWLSGYLGDPAPAETDIQATLAELSATSIAASLEKVGLPDRMLVCGGGVHNTFLMQRLGAAIPALAIQPTSLHGIDPNCVEGLLFAWLAYQRLHGNSQDTTAITGARQAVLLGDVFEP
jgi:anhydro-N-acetylmuramic acid kinase